MGLETSFDNIDDLNTDWPLGTDPKSEGDDHIAGTKRALVANVTGDGLETRLLSGGVVRLVARTNGVEVFGTRFELDSLGDTVLDMGLKNAAGGGGFSLRDISGSLQIHQNSPVGGFEKSWINLNRDAGVDLRFDGITKLQTQSTGAKSNGSLFQVDNSTVDEGTNLRIRNLIGGVKLLISNASGDFSLRQLNPAAGEEGSWLVGERDGRLGLFFDGTERLATTNAGAKIIGDVLDVDNSTLTTPALIRIRNVEGGLEWRTDSGQAILRKTDAAGTIEKIWIVCNANSSVNLLHNDNDAIRTKDRQAALALSGAEVVDRDGVFRDVGFNTMPFASFPGSVTLNESQAGKRVHITGSGTVTIPTGLREGYTVVITALGSDIFVAAAGGQMRWFDGAGTILAPQFILRNGGVMTVYIDSAVSIWGNGISE